MAPDTMRNAVNLAAADARRAIEALQEQSISLQRELAEARAEIDSLKSRPSLAPLTDESVRGVLVDDGPVRNVFDYGECYLDLKDGSINTCWENARDPWSHNMQPVKLRPASEFGVPSTHAESAQKLVPLPEKVHVFEETGEVRLPRQGEFFRDGLAVVMARWNYTTSSYPICRKRDPALYGVDAGERVRELEDGLEFIEGDVGWNGLSSPARVLIRSLLAPKAEGGRAD